MGELFYMIKDPHRIKYLTKYLFPGYKDELFLFKEIEYSKKFAESFTFKNIEIYLSMGNEETGSHKEEIKDNNKNLKEENFSQITLQNKNSDLPFEEKISQAKNAKKKINRYIGINEFKKRSLYKKGVRIIEEKVKKEIKCANFQLSNVEIRFMLVHQILNIWHCPHVTAALLHSIVMKLCNTLSDDQKMKFYRILSFFSKENMTRIALEYFIKEFEIIEKVKKTIFYNFKEEVIKMLENNDFKKNMSFNKYLKIGYENAEKLDLGIWRYKNFFKYHDSESSCKVCDFQYEEQLKRLALIKSNIFCLNNENELFYKFFNNTEDKTAFLLTRENIQKMSEKQLKSYRNMINFLLKDSKTLEITKERALVAVEIFKKVKNYEYYILCGHAIPFFCAVIESSNFGTYTIFTMEAVEREQEAKKKEIVRKKIEKINKRYENDEISQSSQLSDNTNSISSSSSSSAENVIRRVHYSPSSPIVISYTRDYFYENIINIR